MTEIFVVGIVSIGFLLGLLTMISTLIGQRLPQILAAVDAGVSEAALRSSALHCVA